MPIEELNKIVKYFEDNSTCLIEAEVKDTQVASFKETYKTLTGSEDIDSTHFHSISNKWGIELRIYYTSNENTPREVLELSTSNSRPGFTEYTKRICNNEIIYELFKKGFKIGVN